MTADQEDELVLRAPHFWARGWLHFSVRAGLAVTSLALAWDVAGLLLAGGYIDSPELRGPLVGLGLFLMVWAAALVVCVAVRRVAQRDS